MAVVQKQTEMKRKLKQIQPDLCVCVIALELAWNIKILSAPL